MYKIIKWCCGLEKYSWLNVIVLKGTLTPFCTLNTWIFKICWVFPVLRTLLNLYQTGVEKIWLTLAWEKLFIHLSVNYALPHRNCCVKAVTGAFKANEGILLVPVYQYNWCFGKILKCKNATGTSSYYVSYLILVLI